MCCRDTVRNVAPRAQYFWHRSEHLPNKEFEASNLHSIDDSNVHSPELHFECHVYDCDGVNKEIDHQNLDNPNYVDSTTIDPSVENRPVFKSRFQTVNSERRGSIETVLSRSTTTRTVSPSGLCFDQENLGSGPPDTMHESMELHNLKNTHHERRRQADTGLNSPFTLRSPAPVDTRFGYMELHRNNSTHVGRRRVVETDLSPPTSPRSRSPDDLRSGLMELHHMNNTHKGRQRHEDIGSSPPTSPKSLLPVDTQFGSMELHHINKKIIGRRRYADTGLSPPTSPRSRSPFDSRRYVDTGLSPPTTPRSLSPSDAFFTSGNVSRYSPNTLRILSLDEESFHIQSDSEDERGSRILTITPIGSANEESGISTIDL